MFPFTYYEYKANKEKQSKENQDIAHSSNLNTADSSAPDPFEKSKALGVGSLMSATPDELEKEFISPHAPRHKKPDYKKENEAYDGPVRSYILPRDSWNILDGPSLLKH